MLRNVIVTPQHGKSLHRSVSFFKAFIIFDRSTSIQHISKHRIVNCRPFHELETKCQPIITSRKGSGVPSSFAHQRLPLAWVCRSSQLSLLTLSRRTTSGPCCAWRVVLPSAVWTPCHAAAAPCLPGQSHGTRDPTCELQRCLGEVMEWWKKVRGVFSTNMLEMRREPGLKMKCIKRPSASGIRKRTWISTDFSWQFTRNCRREVTWTCCRVDGAWWIWLWGLPSKKQS